MLDVIGGAVPGGVFGGAGGFIGSAVSQKLGGGKVDWKKAWGAAANGAIIGAVQGGLVASGAGIPVALASNFMAGTVGSATEQLISEGKIDARKSITSGLTNAVSNAIYGTDPLKGVINAAVRGAGAGAATAGINYISDFIGQKPEWREMETGFLTGMAGKYISSYGGVERNPRRGCENISSFVKSTGYSLAKGYRYKVPGTSVIQKQKKFDFGEFLGETVFGGVVGGFTSAGFYGAGKGIERLKNSFRIGEGGSGSVQTISNKFPNDNQVGKKFKYTTRNGGINIENGVQNVDFVIDKDGNLHIGRGHSYLAGGSSVQAAGTMKVNSQGYIRLITNDSGHFQPTTVQAMNYPTVFRNVGLNVDNAWIRIGEFETSMSNYIIDSKVFYNGPIKNMP